MHQTRRQRPRWLAQEAAQATNPAHRNVFVCVRLFLFIFNYKMPDMISSSSCVVFVCCAVVIFMTFVVFMVSFFLIKTPLFQFAHKNHKKEAETKLISDFNLNCPKK